MTLAEAAAAMSREGALQRAAAAREPILAKARAMRAAANLPPASALAPTLILTAQDRIGRHISSGE